MKGKRDPNKLWHLDNLHPSHSLNAAIHQPTVAERIRFFHASLFSPTLDTLCKAINAGFLQSFPCFTSKQIRKHPPVSEATIKGHLNAKRQNTRSTKKPYKSPFFLYNTANSPHLIPNEEPKPQQIAKSPIPPSIQTPTTPNLIQ